jgi:hypothetical protein
MKESIDFMAGDGRMGIDRIELTSSDRVIGSHRGRRQTTSAAIALP